MIRIREGLLSSDMQNHITINGKAGLFSFQFFCLCVSVVNLTTVSSSTIYFAGYVFQQCQIYHIYILKGWLDDM